MNWKIGHLTPSFRWIMSLPDGCIVSLLRNVLLYQDAEDSGIQCRNITLADIFFVGFE